MTKVDEKYYINMAEIMEKNTLPKPRKRLLSGDGEYLPIIEVEVEV